MKRSFLVIFSSTRAFISARKSIVEHQIPHEVRSTPPYLDPECGMCLKVEEDYRQEVESLLNHSEESLIVDYRE